MTHFSTNCRINTLANYYSTTTLAPPKNYSKSSPLNLSASMLQLDVAVGKQLVSQSITKAVQASTSCRWTKKLKDQMSFWPMPSKAMPYASTQQDWTRTPHIYLGSTIIFNTSLMLLRPSTKPKPPKLALALPARQPHDPDPGSRDPVIQSCFLKINTHNQG
jgi:hypothetical protein